jgi:hypothetical protein
MVHTTFESDDEVTTFRNYRQLCAFTYSDFFTELELPVHDIPTKMFTAESFTVAKLQIAKIKFCIFFCFDFLRARLCLDGTMF